MTITCGQGQEKLSVRSGPAGWTTRAAGTG
jgi:hypothetical protein